MPAVTLIVRSTPDCEARYGYGKAHAQAGMGNGGAASDDGLAEV